MLFSSVIYVFQTRSVSTMLSFTYTKGEVFKKTIPDMNAFKKPFDIANGFTTFRTAVVWESYVMYRYVCTHGFIVILLVVSLN